MAIRQLSLTETQIRGLLRLTAEVRQQPTRGKLNELVMHAIELVKPECEHKAIRLTEPGEVPGGQVRDAEQVEAAILNLIRNAMEAAGPGGNVQVDCGSENGLMFVDVIDSGAGIPIGMERKVFEPFVSNTPEGVGLGLPLAVQAARDHGGNVVYDRPDGKTRFRFTLQTEVTL